MNFIIRNNRGFSLVEILIAIVILTVGILGISSMTFSVIKGNTTSSQRSQATILAIDRIEQLSKIPYPSIIIGNDNTNPAVQLLYDDASNGDQSAGDNIYTSTENDVNGTGITRITALTLNTPETNTSTLDVTTSWTNNYGPRSVALTTILSLY